MKFLSKHGLIATAIASAIVASCGNSGPGGGLAAVGAPLANAAITILDGSGNILSIQAGADGTFKLPAGTPGPMLLKAVGSQANLKFTLYSIALSVAGEDLNFPGASQEALNQIKEALEPTEQNNINPLTDVMTRQTLGGAAAIEARFSSKTPPVFFDFSKTQVEPTDLGNTFIDATSLLATQMADLVVCRAKLLTDDEFGNANPFAATMKADHSDPLDVLLDSALVRCSDIRLNLQTGLPVSASGLDLPLNADGSFPTAGTVPDATCSSYIIQPKFPVTDQADYASVGGAPLTGDSQGIGCSADGSGESPRQGQTVYGKRLTPDTMAVASFAAFRKALASLANLGGNSIILGCQELGPTTTTTLAPITCQIVGATGDTGPTWYSYDPSAASAVWVKAANQTQVAQSNSAAANFCGSIGTAGGQSDSCTKS